MTKSNRRIRRRAFTLVELLVVVAIIALLAAMLFPALRGAKKRARQVACMSNLRQLGAATMLYAVENNGSMPVAVVVNRVSGGGGGPGLCAANGVPVNVGQLYPYLNENAEVFFCPGYSRPRTVSSVGGLLAVPGKAIHNIKEAAMYFKTNWVNAYTMSTTASIKPGYAFVPHVQVASGAQNIPIEVVNADAPPSGLWSWKLIATKLDRNLPPYTKIIRPIILCSQTWAVWGDYGGAHDGKGSNVLFADGRVVWWPYDWIGTGSAFEQGSYTGPYDGSPKWWSALMNLYNR